MRSQYVACLATLFAMAGCLRDSSECIVSADCPEAQVCSSGVCALRTGTADTGTASDAGRDASTDPSDSGTTDASSATDASDDAGLDASTDAETDACSDTRCVPFFDVPCESLVSGYIKPSDTTELDAFGEALAIHGDVLVVGAPSRGVRGLWTGAAYVFERRGGQWVQTAILEPDVFDLEDRFGEAVTVHGDVIVVGAPGEDGASTGANGDDVSDGAEDSGAVYVFERNGPGADWSPRAYLKPSNTSVSAEFGASLAYDGVHLVVGAPNEAGNASGVDDDPSGYDLFGAGAAYVFTQETGAGWTQGAYLKASDPGESDRFGVSVSVSDGLVAVGAPNANEGGQAYVYSNRSGSWAGPDVVTDDLIEPGAFFGQSVSLDGVVLAIGAPGVMTDTKELAGAAYVYEPNERGAWARTAALRPENAYAFMQFGDSVALSGETLLVGADGEGSGEPYFVTTTITESDSGAAYVFTRTNDDWTSLLEMKSPFVSQDDFFGDRVALDDKTLAIGMPGDDSSHLGVGTPRTDDDAESSGAVVTYDLE